MSDVRDDDLIPGVSEPALGLLEFSSVALGIRAGDAMVKRAPVRALVAGSVQPGKFLVLVDGDVASVEESLAAGVEAGAPAVLDRLFLPDVHPDVARAVAGRRDEEAIESLGVLETRTAAAAILAADAALKGASVRLVELRLANGLGGRGLALVAGEVADVEAAVEIATARLAAGALHHGVVVPRLHGEMAENLLVDTRFARQWGGTEG